MSYLLTNASALTALQNLTSTQSSLGQVQSQLSTGLKIQSAADNSSYWSIATTMSSDNGALGVVSSALATSQSMLSTFNSAVVATISVVNQIKNDLVSAQNPGSNITQLQSDINAQQAALLQIANASTFNGQNWLNATISGSASSTLTSSTPLSLVGSYTNSGGVGAISVQTSAVNMFTTTGTNGVTGVQAVSGGILASAASWNVLGYSAFNITSSAGSSAVATMLTNCNTALTNLETSATTVGSALTQTTIQASFATTMQNNLSNGIAALVNADMNQVSTRLQALQTQQQLGVQSLSIANQSTQMILRLFQ
jgi:flagellin